MPSFTLIRTADVGENQITSTVIADGAVGSDQIAAGSVVAAKLGSAAVETAKIADLNVTTGKLANAAVSTAKLADDAVTPAKLADVSGLGMSQDTDGTLDVRVDDATIEINGSDNLQIKNLGVVTAKIADLNVTRAKLEADAIDGTKLADAAVDTEHLAADAVERAKIADDAVGADQLDLAASYAFESSSAITVASGGSISWATSPSSANHLVNKSYVDGKLAGLTWKQSVRAASGGNITLSGTQTIDGVSLVAGDRVLVGKQSAGAENGIYVVASGSWSRAEDMNAAAEFPSAAVFVREGTGAGDRGYVCTNDSVTVGSTAVEFVEFTGAYLIDAGDGMTKAGNTLNVVAGNGLAVAADEVSAKVAASGGLTNAGGTGNDSLAIRLQNGVQTDSNGLTLRLAGGSSTIEFDSAETAGQQGIKVKFDNAKGLQAASNGLEVRVDPASLEFASGQINVKDGGIDTAELADSAVQTAKIGDAQVTFAKLSNDVKNRFSGYDSEESLSISSDAGTATFTGVTDCPLTTPGHLFFINGRLMLRGSSGAGDYTVAQSGSNLVFTVHGNVYDGDKLHLVYDSTTNIPS